MSAPLIRILGIDPGLRRTGWGVVDVAGNRLMFVACGSVETNERDDVAARLVAIHRGLARVRLSPGVARLIVSSTTTLMSAGPILATGRSAQRSQSPLRMIVGSLWASP